MDNCLHIMLNGEPLESWDAHPAAEAWFTATKGGVRQITKKENVVWNSILGRVGSQVQKLCQAL